MELNYNVKSSESIDNTGLAVDDDAANIANVIPQKQIYFYYIFIMQGEWMI